MRKSILLLLLFITIASYSQNKSRQFFDNDSIINVTNYFGTFEDVMDSIVIKGGKRKLVITEKDIYPFFYKETPEILIEEGQIGICPFGINDFHYINKRVLAISALERNSFGCNLYLILINKKTGKFIKMIQTESRKSMNKLSILIKDDHIYIPKEENYIRTDSIQVLDKKRNLSFITSSDSTQHIKPIDEESFFRVNIE